MVSSVPGRSGTRFSNQYRFLKKASARIAPRTLLNNENAYGREERCNHGRVIRERGRESLEKVWNQTDFIIFEPILMNLL